MSVVINVSNFSNGSLPIKSADSAGDVICQDFFYDITAAQLLTGDIIDMGILPAYHTVTDMILISSDIDTGSAAVTLDVGLMSGTPGDSTNTRTCGAEFFAASVSGQAGAIDRMSLPGGFKVLATQADRSIGVKILLQPATAAAGRIRLRVLMHPSDPNVQF